MPDCVQNKGKAEEAYKPKGTPFIDFLGLAT